MLALARSVPAADATMKQGMWDKKKLIGRGAARQDARPRRPRPHRPGGRGARARVRHGDRRARSVHLRATSPTRSASSCSTSTSSAQTADYISLHVPATPETRHLFGKDAARALQEGRAHRQHRARRTDRRGRARRRDRSPGTSPAPPSTCSRRAAGRLARLPSCRRSSRRRTSRRRPPKPRSWSASRRPPPCATS